MILVFASVAVFAQDSVSYARPEAWLCRPGRTDACSVDLSTTILSADGTRKAERWAATAAPAVDCFYVYPTVSRDTGTYSDMQAGDEERDVVRSQFARFGSICRRFAPLYRQVTVAGLGRMFSSPNSGISMSRGTNYDDVLAAWNHYLANDNKGRGVVLIGHSQGAYLLDELIRWEIDGKSAQSLVVSALLIGANIPVPVGKDLGGSFQSMPLCRRDGQTGCVVSFVSFRSTVPPSGRALFGRVTTPGMQAACTNPAALSGGSRGLHSYFSAAPSIFERTATTAYRWVRTDPQVTTQFVSVPGLVSGECVADSLGSRLVLTVHGDPADPRADDIPGDMGAPGTATRAQWGMHLVDMSATMGDLLSVVARQASAFKAPAARPAARPAGLPPAMQPARGVPRLSNGKPDMNGIWRAFGNDHYDIEPHNARGALAWREGPVVPVPAAEVVALGAVGSVPSGRGIVGGGKIPYTPAALARRNENRANWLSRDPEIKCYLPGVPRANYMPFPFQVFQSTSAFFISYEYAGATRNILLKDPGPPEVDSWMGQSVGRWEGDTFVVAVSGFNAETWFDRAGNHHSEALKVTERWTMAGPDHIRYEATMEDPQTFTRPWTIRTTLYRDVDPDARLGQFKCVEFVEELLYGHLRKRPVTTPPPAKP